MTWDDELSYLLMPALVSYENEQLLGVSVCLEEFQQSIKVTVPVGHTFKVRGKHARILHCWKSVRSEQMCFTSGIVRLGRKSVQEGMSSRSLIEM